MVSIIKSQFIKYRAKIPQWSAFVIYFAIVLGPGLVLGGAAVRAILNGGDDILPLLIPTARRLNLLVNSLCLAGVVSVACICLGWIGAVILWSWPERKSFPFLWVILPLAALPSHVHALAWLSITSSLSRLLDSGFSGPLQGWTGALWVEIAAFSPLALGFAWLGLRSIDPELIEAARLSRPDFQNLFRIALPLSAPATLTGGGIIFLLSILDFSVPSLFQVNVYALEVFAEYSASNSPEGAFVLSLPLLFIAVGLIVGLLEPLQQLTLRQVNHKSTWPVPLQMPILITTLGWIAGFLLVVQAFSPMAAMILLGGTSNQLIPTIVQAGRETVYSLQVAALAGLVSLPIALGVARILARNSHTRKILWLLVMAPVAIPASLVGVSLIYLFNRVSLAQEVFLSMLPVFASMARFMPLATLVLLAQLRRTDSLLFDAARVFQPSAWRRAFQVSVPLLAPGLLSAAGITFAFSLGELGATLMVIPPGKSTLTMRIYNYLHYGASDAVMGLSALLTFSVILAGAMVAFAVSLWSRFSTTPEVRS